MTDATHDDELTIDELARVTGMTVRNVRAHQSRGLLPPPVVRGRTGFYGPDHIARIELIKQLQADGFNLEGIRRLIEQAGGQTEDVLRFTRRVRSAFEDEEVPEVYELDELIERFQAGPEVLPKAIDLGLLRPIGDDRFEMVSPRLGRVGEDFVKIGIRLERAMETLAMLRKSADGVAQAYIELFLDGVWRPFEEAGRPPERWQEVEDALEQLRPLATEAVLAVFSIVMTEAIEHTVEEQIIQYSGEDGREEPHESSHRHSGSRRPDRRGRRRRQRDSR